MCWWSSEFLKVCQRETQKLSRRWRDWSHAQAGHKGCLHNAPPNASLTTGRKQTSVTYFILNFVNQELVASFTFKAEKYE